MQNYLHLLFSGYKKMVLFTFFIALALRLLLLPMNHTKNNSIDLNIIIETGQLINNGVNIYNYADGIEIRNRLRLDNIAYNSYVSGSQDAWDYYTSSNLPMSSLFFGLIDKISNNNPIIFRIIFALFDSILSAFIALILVKYWHLKHTWLNIALILGLAALSPVLILWGSVNPEDKGLQTLFMLSAVYFAKNKNLFLSSVLLGCSVAFKGLGIFISPICLYFIIGEPENIFKIDRQQIKKGVIYTLLSLFFAIVWFIPYMPHVLTMMQDRLTSNLNSEAEPVHGSIWTIIYPFLPGTWIIVKNSLIIILSVIWSYAFIFKKINVTAISLFLLVLFVDIMLLQGSLDRMNIGIMVSMILFCFIDLRFSKVLAWYTIIIGWCFYFMLIIKGNTNETLDAIFTIGYLSVFSSYPLIYLIQNKNKLSVIGENKET